MSSVPVQASAVRNNSHPALQRSGHGARVVHNPDTVTYTPEQIGQWKEAMRAGSAVVQGKRKLGAGLLRTKYSSAQYHFAKYKLNAEQRTALSAVLQQDIADMTRRGEDSGELVDMFCSLQFARLRVHSQDERNAYHVEMSLTSAASAVMVAPFVLTGFCRNVREKYDRSDRRQEYPDAFNDMMRMLSASPEEVPPAAKHKIAETILDRCIREQKLLNQVDTNRVLMALPGAADARTALISRGNHVQQTDPYDGAGELHGLRSLLLKRPSTPQQRDALIAWAGNESVTHVNMSGYRLDRDRRRLAAIRALLDGVLLPQVSLHIRLADVYAAINERLQSQGLEQIQVPADLRIFNDLPNAAAFDRLLERAQEDANSPGNTTGNYLYNNMRIILGAIQGDRDFARQIFEQSVGGERHCINNALEKLDELAASSVRHGVLRRVENGAMDMAAFTRVCLQNFRLETLQSYILDTVIPHLESLNYSIAENYGPEVARSLKWTLKGSLDLPETVTPSISVYPRKSELHAKFASGAQMHVHAAAGNPATLHAFLEADPLWREGIVALTKKYNPQDAARLNNCLNAGNYFEKEGQICDESGAVVNDANAQLAFRAVEDLASLFRPAAQYAWGATMAQDRYRTDHPEHQELHDRIVQLERIFKLSMHDIERQLAAHATPAMLSNPATLPEDGGFNPNFSLPHDWDEMMADIKPRSLAAERIELAERNRVRGKEIEKLEAYVANMGLGLGKRYGMDESQMDALIESLRIYNQNKRGGVAARSTDGPAMLRSPLHQFEITEINTATGEEETRIPQDLLDLNDKVVNLLEEQRTYASAEAFLRTLPAPDKGKGKAPA